MEPTTDFLKLSRNVGRKAYFYAEGLAVECIVTDARLRPTPELEIMPRCGEGRTWISAERVFIPGEGLQQMNLAPAVDGFLRDCEARGYGVNTTRAYRADLSAFQSFFGGQFHAGAEPPEIKRELRGFLGELHSRYPNRNTLCRKWESLRSFFDWCAFDGRMRMNYLSFYFPTPKQPHWLPHVLTEREVWRLLNAPLPFKKSIIYLRDKAALELLYSSGLRVEELVSLDTEDLELFDETVMVRHGKGGKQRIVPVGSVALEAVKDYLDERRRWRTEPEGVRHALFVGYKSAAYKPVSRLSSRAVRNIIKEWAHAARINRPVYPHILRHCCATHLMDRGMDIRYIGEILGHVSLRTTERYTHVSVRQLRRVYDHCHPRGRLYQGERSLLCDKMPTDRSIQLISNLSDIGRENTVRNS